MVREARFAWDSDRPLPPEMSRSDWDCDDPVPSDSQAKTRSSKSRRMRARKKQVTPDDDAEDESIAE